MKIPWQTYLSELIGTALLVGVGLSFVILNCGEEFTWLKKFRIDVAKIYHFGHDRYGVFRKHNR
ncbi:MAG TPA: hypothetical protein VIK59_08770 [Verrucomicrobiae bacterium]